MDIDRLQERLEGIIRRIGGKHAEDLIEAIDLLAEIDIRIRDAIDEIEVIDEATVRQHNELAERINRMTEEVEAEKERGGGGETAEGHDGCGSEPDFTVQIRIQVE